MTDKPAATTGGATAAPAAAAAGAAKPHITKPSRLIAAAKAGEDNLIEEYLSDKSKNIDVNKVSGGKKTKKNSNFQNKSLTKKKKKKTDSLGQTAIHWACASGYPTTVQLLVRFGGRIDVRDKSGETPLHKAAWRGSAECVQLLLKLGADPDATNAAGKKPLDLCRVRDVRRLLVPQEEVGPDDEEPDQEDPDSD